MIDTFAAMPTGALCFYIAARIGFGASLIAVSTGVFLATAIFVAKDMIRSPADPQFLRFAWVSGGSHALCFWWSSRLFN